MPEVSFPGDRISVLAVPSVAVCSENIGSTGGGGGEASVYQNISACSASTTECLGRTKVWASAFNTLQTASMGVGTFVKQHMGVVIHAILSVNQEVAAL